MFLQFFFTIYKSVLYLIFRFIIYNCYVRDILPILCSTNYLLKLFFMKISSVTSATQLLLVNKWILDLISKEYQRPFSDTVQRYHIYIYSMKISINWKVLQSTKFLYMLECRFWQNPHIKQYFPQSMKFGIYEDEWILSISPVIVL